LEAVLFGTEFGSKLFSKFGPNPIRTRPVKPGLRYNSGMAVKQRSLICGILFMK